MEGLAVSEVILDATAPKITINELEIENYEVYNFLSGMDEEERIDFVKRALRVGTVVLQMMDTTKRVDYVRGEFDKMQKRIDSELENVFSEKGLLMESLDRFLGEQGELKRALDSHFGPQGTLIYKILNPDDESTPIGKFRKQLQQQLNADMEGTAFHKLRKEIEEGFKEVLFALGAVEAAEKEREKSTAKGGDFENYIYEMVDVMARSLEDTVEFVGNEGGPLGKVGDVLIHLNIKEFGNIERSIVIEAKNRRVNMSGKTSFLKELEKAKKNRKAHYAIGAVHESQVPAAVGCFRRYGDGKIICSIPAEEYPLALEIAYKVARAELIASSMRQPTRLDTSQLKAKIVEIQGQLSNLQGIRSALTGATGKINGAKEDIKEMEEAIRKTINDILTMIRNNN